MVEPESNGSLGKQSAVQPGASPTRSTNPRRSSTAAMLENEATSIRNMVTSTRLHGSTGKDGSVRFLMAGFLPTVVDSRDTVGRALLGKGGAEVMWSLLKGPWGVAANICFLSGLVVHIATTTGWIAYHFAYLTLPMLLYLIPNVASMNRYIVGRLFRSFDFYLYFAYLSGFALALITSLSDERAVSISVGYVLGIYLLCTDALPEKVRIRTLKFGVPVFALAVFSICTNLYLGAFMDLAEWSMEFRGVSYKSGTIALSAGANFLVFNTKCIFHAIKNPQRFSVIGSKLTSIKGNPNHVGAVRHFNNQLVKKLGKLAKNKVAVDERSIIGDRNLDSSIDEETGSSSSFKE
mmetsp:Transcript_25174/g.52283  ORF Transcript_25174/g.52283 Transcript_25174/m.52283 type:complete len:350 (+) Transcript_25174:121-1170(+)